MSRRRSGPDGRWSVALVCWMLLALAFWQGALASGDTAGTVPRGSAVDVVDDASAVVGVDTNDSVRTNATDRLVTVSNRLGQRVTVTVQLRTGSTDVGDLVVDGSVAGDAATVGLDPGAAVDVAIRIPDDGDLVGRTVAVDVDAGSSGLWATVTNRSSTVGT